jgi:hypothetical protein
MPKTIHVGCELHTIRSMAGNGTAPAPLRQLDGKEEYYHELTVSDMVVD